MNHYQHLSIEERESLLIYKERGLSITEIARMTGRSKSTISREFKRNCNQRTKAYSTISAEKKYQKRRAKCRKKRLLDDPVIQEAVRSLIVAKTWSPEQISGRLRYEENPIQISYATIYRAINARVFDLIGVGKNARGFKKHLRHKGKARKSANKDEKRGKLDVPATIEERPTAADERSEKGHWEADTVAGERATGCVLTLAERHSRFFLAEKLSANKATLVHDAMIKLFSSIPSEFLKSITPDRGKEFTLHEKISQALNDTPFFFANPHAPWDKPSVENANGLLRQFMPKRTSFEAFSNDFLQEKVCLMNLRPRKCLGWKTPFEVLFDQTLHLT